MEKFIASYTTEEDAANDINNFFVEICTSKSNVERQSKFDDAPIPENKLPTINEVYNILRNSKNKKIDRGFRLILLIYYAYLYTIYLHSLRTKSFPTRWKMDTITPVPKSKIVKEPEELRPITITEVPAKLFEKIVDCRIEPFIT